MIARRSFLLSAAAFCSASAARAELVTPITDIRRPRHIGYGDSVFAGENRFGKPITKALTSKVGLNSFNAAIGGTSMARGLNEIYDSLSMFELCNANGEWKEQFSAVNTFSPSRKAYYYNVIAVLKSTPLEKIDLATFAYGVNDFAGSRHIGTDDDDTKETFKGAVNHIITKFLSHGRPKIMLSTPVWCVGEDVANAAGHKLADYADAILRLGALRSIPVLDLYRTSGINSDNASNLLVDGLHPNADGYDVLADRWATALLSVF